MRLSLEIYRPAVAGLGWFRFLPFMGRVDRARPGMSGEGAIKLDA